MAEYIDIVGIKQAVNKGKMQAFVRDGSIYLQCKVSGECVKSGDAPAADVAPVVHGRWIMHDDEFGLTCECSECHIETCGDTPHCPHCGAKMKLVKWPWMDGGKENAAD